MAKRSKRPKRLKETPAHYIRAWRKSREWTIEDLAERSGLSGGAISQIETGDQGTSRKSLQQIATAFGCGVPDLFHDPNDINYKLWVKIRHLRPSTQAQALRLVDVLEDQIAD